MFFEKNNDATPVDWLSVREIEVASLLSLCHDRTDKEPTCSASTTVSMDSKGGLKVSIQLPRCPSQVRQFALGGVSA